MLSLDDGPLMHMIRLARDVGPRGARAGAARLSRLLPLRRRHGHPGRRLAVAAARRRGWCWPCWCGSAPTCLLLDEPTNHLDLTTREALSMALNEFEGTVMLVSHDRALLREVCDEFWLVSAGGVVKPFDGDLDDYQKWLLDNSREMAKAARKPRNAPAKAKKAASAPAAGGKQPRCRAVPAASARRPQGCRGRCAPAARRTVAKPLRKELNQHRATASACCSPKSDQVEAASSPSTDGRAGAAWPRPANA